MIDTVENRKLIEQRFKEGKTLTSIAKELGCSPNNISRIRDKIRDGKPPGSSKKAYPKFDYDRIEKLLREGVDEKAIMERVGCSNTVVRQVRRARIGKYKSDQLPSADEKIKELLEKGLPPESIAHRLGCSKSPVYRVRKELSKPSEKRGLN